MPRGRTKESWTDEQRAAHSRRMRKHWSDPANRIRRTIGELERLEMAFKSRDAARQSGWDSTLGENFTRREEPTERGTFSPHSEQGGYEEDRAGAFMEGVRSTGSLVGHGSKSPPRIETRRRGRSPFDARKGMNNRQPMK
jgi:hypothetical protein